MSSPPGGYYYCQPLLTSSTQLIRSNVVPLQPQSFYQDRGISPCLVNEFQNSTIPFCAQEGVTLGPNQIIEPAPTVIEEIQTINASVEMRPTQSGLLVIEKTPTPSNSLSNTDSSFSVTTTEEDSDTREMRPASDNNQTLPIGLIAGIVVIILSAVVSTILLSILVAFVRLKTKQRKKFVVTDANRYLESPDGFDGKSP